MATYKVKRQGKQYTASVAEKAAGGSIVTIEGRTFEVELDDSEARIQGAGIPPTFPSTTPISEHESDGSVVAPIPGHVVSVLVHVGDSVHAGQVVLRLEAMKMENDITSPISGIVKEISVRAGSEPRVGQLLMKIA